MLMCSVLTQPCSKVRADLPPIGMVKFGKTGYQGFIFLSGLPHRSTSAGLTFLHSITDLSLALTPQKQGFCPALCPQHLEQDW